jgi:hypothetical protein
MVLMVKGQMQVQGVVGVVLGLMVVQQVRGHQHKEIMVVLALIQQLLVHQVVAVQGQ